MLRILRSIVLWIYDFLAEDPVLLAGAAAAVLVALLLVNITRIGSGFLLWAVILVALTVSLWRTARQ